MKKILDILAWILVLVMATIFVVGIIGVVIALIISFVQDPLYTALYLSPFALIFGCLWGLHRLFGEKHERTF
jgi:lipopolysaccharide export LptBFGC system permease protein LptF